MTERLVDLELSPMSRQSGVAYIHGIDLGADVDLSDGYRLVVRDEGGALWDAVMTSREQVRFGVKYRLSIERVSGGGA